MGMVYRTRVRERRIKMNTSLVIVVRLQDVKAVIQKIEDAYRPNIMHVTVKEERITRDIPLSFQIQGDQDPHDYLDTPLCRIEVGLHRFPEKELDERFLSELALQFTIIN